MTKKLELTGRRFGRLLVQYQAEHGPSKEVRWVCLCDCGTLTTVARCSLGRATNSCGCLEAENRKTMSTTHGLSRSPEYFILSNARARCENTKNAAWPRYGGRGIRVKFKDAQELINHIGRRPGSEYSLDRVDNDGDYEPGNVRWATAVEQRNNRRDSVLYELNGVRDNVKGWAARAGVRPSSISYRIKAGWDIAEALTLPATRPQLKETKC